MILFGRQFCIVIYAGLSAAFFIQSSHAEPCFGLQSAVVKSARPVRVRSISPSPSEWAPHQVRIQHPSTRIYGTSFAWGPKNKPLITSLEEHGRRIGYSFHNAITGGRFKVQPEPEARLRSPMKGRENGKNLPEPIIGGPMSSRLVVNPSGTIAIDHSGTRAEVVATRKVQSLGFLSMRNTPVGFDLYNGIHFLDDSRVVSLNKYGRIDLQQVSTTASPDIIWGGQLILDPARPTHPKQIDDVVFYKNRITVALKNGKVLIYDLQDSSAYPSFDSENSEFKIAPSIVLNFARKPHLFASENGFHTFFITRVPGKSISQIGRIEASGKIVNLVQFPGIPEGNPNFLALEVVPLQGEAFAVIQNLPTRKLHFYTADGTLKKSYEFPIGEDADSSYSRWYQKLDDSFKTLSSGYSAARGLLAIGTYHGVMALFDTHTGQLKTEFYSEPLRSLGGQAHEIRHLTFSPDGSMLSVAGHLGAHLIYDTDHLLE